MVKRGVESVALTVNTCAAEISPEGAMQVTPAPGPQTPEGSPGSDANEAPPPPTDFPIGSCELEDSGTAFKKMRVQFEFGQVPHLLDSVGSQASTAAPTPAGTPCASPSFVPTAASPNEGVWRTNYSKLSVPDLRELLGVVGTDIAVGWERAELESVLEELDKVLPGMATLKI